MAVFLWAAGRPVENDDFAPARTFDRFVTWEGMNPMTTLLDGTRTQAFAEQPLDIVNGVFVAEAERGSSYGSLRHDGRA